MYIQPAKWATVSTQIARDVEMKFRPSYRPLSRARTLGLLLTWGLAPQALCRRPLVAGSINHYGRNHVGAA